MRYSIRLLAFLALFNACCRTWTFASTEPYWNWRNPVPQGNDYNAVAYGSGRFVAVGRVGTITTSTDGITWSAANSGLNTELATIAYGNGRFVAKGYVAGGSGLLVSDDGLSWSVPDASLPSGWGSVTLINYAGDRFFAMSNSAFEAKINVHLVATSTDGLHWTTSTAATTAKVGRIAFGGGSYVGQDMMTGELSSADGITWTFNEAKMLRSSDGITWVTGGATGLAAISAGPVYFDGRWVVGGTLATTTTGGVQQFHRALSASADGGATWTVTWNDENFGWGGNSPIADLAVFDGRLVLLGDPNVPILSTADLATVRKDLPMQMLQLTSAAAAASRVVAVGRYGQIVSSADGVNWTSLASNTVQGNLRAAAFGGGKWIAAGDAGLAASSDGITWGMLPSGAAYTEGSIAYGNGRFVAGTITGHIGVSTDQGATWTDSGALGIRGPIGFAQGRFVASSGLVNSTDGVTWSTAIPAPGGTGIWTGVFTIDDVFYAVGTTDPAQEKNGVIARSIDGLVWTTVATMPERVASVGGKDGLIVACGYMGEVWTSTDGVTWTRVSGKPLLSFGVASSVLWVGDSLVGTTFSGQVVLSADGMTWTKDEFASSGTMFAMAAGNGQILALGSGGVIWEVGAARFTSQPESQAVAAGEAVTLSVAAMGKEPLTYQWQKNGSPIGGAKSKTYTLSSIQVFDEGNYSVVVSNSIGSTTSNPASIVVNATPTAPLITTQPESKTVTAGNSVTFSIVATGTGSLNYQWRKDNAAIVGATGSSYTIPAVSSSDSGTYTVDVWNSSGAVSSSKVTLSVGGAASATRFVNIATRAYATTNNGVTIGGFVIAGSQSKQVLIRGVGPSLATQGIEALETLADPVIELHHGADTLEVNDNWGDNANAASITSTGLRVGATALATGDTKSAAILRTLDPGIYTFIARGKNDSSGIVLLEVYDAESGGSSFVNIASRVRCTTNNGVAIGGFVVSGTAAKQVLMRAVGPTLTSQGIGQSEVLLDPTIELHRGAATLETNDDWSSAANASDIVSVGARIGATPFAAGDTKSSALLMTLQPGVYSFIVRGKNDTSGIVLVEVYDAD